jgi:hypothetical protein
VFEDLREECSKYGQVVEVKVPRPANPALSAALFGTDNYGKVRRLSGRADMPADASKWVK